MDECKGIWSFLYVMCLFLVFHNLNRIEKLIDMTIEIGLTCTLAGCYNCHHAFHIIEIDL
jgi:uncharacterized protein YebE (UPF0316 family)